MNALAPYLLALYQTDLLAEAEITRRARLASKSQPGIPAWRRSLGGAFAYVARSIDPSLRSSRSGGQVARRAA